MKWVLKDVEMLYREHPYTFYRPSAQIIAALGIGNRVALVFAALSDDAGQSRSERLWVEINFREGDRFAGVLEDESPFFANSSFGVPVTFESRHITGTDLVFFEPPIPEICLRYCRISHRVLGGATAAGALYREPAEDDTDSGWRILVGDEPKGVGTRDLALVPMGRVLNVDDSLVALLGASPGSAFRRSAQGFLEPM